MEKETTDKLVQALQYILECGDKGGWEYGVAHDVLKETGLLPCKHEYVEARNFGQDRDNVECRKCGMHWIRNDRVAVRNDTLEEQHGTMLQTLRYIASYGNALPAEVQNQVNRCIRFVEEGK